MQDTFKKLQKDFWKTLAKFGIKRKPKPTMITETYNVFEINLVPEVKRRMIQTMKIRNIILFVCIILLSAAGGTVAILGSIAGGQSIALAGQDSRIQSMSQKLNGYEGLGELLTIQQQLGDVSDINSNKKVLSRVFSILSAILPKAPDTIEISELTIDLAANTLIFDAQADAKVAPDIDYRVLESFKKGFGLMKYDYGRYVDANEEEIPTRCMIETGEDGTTLEDDGGIYAYWMKGRKGCDPSRDDEDEEEVSDNYTVGQSNLYNAAFDEENKEEREEENEDEAQKLIDEFNEYMDSLDDYARKLAEQQLNEGTKTMDVEVVKVYRTPQFQKWYNAEYMTLGGEISGVPHFQSACIKYAGEELSSTVKWTSENECMLAADDPVIRDSSNGRDSIGNLVLRFNATLSLNEAVFKFDNKHVMAISPDGQNVTDSYVQIEGMFAERAADCSDNDVVCTTTATSSGEEE